MCKKKVYATKNTIKYQQNQRKFFKTLQQIEFYLELDTIGKYPWHAQRMSLLLGVFVAVVSIMLGLTV